MAFAHFFVHEKGKKNENYDYFQLLLLLIAGELTKLGLRAKLHFEAKKETVVDFYVAYRTLNRSELLVQISSHLISNCIYVCESMYYYYMTFIHHGWSLKRQFLTQAHQTGDENRKLMMGWILRAL